MSCLFCVVLLPFSLLWGMCEACKEEKFVYTFLFMCRMFAFFPFWYVVGGVHTRTIPSARRPRRTRGMSTLRPFMVVQLADVPEKFTMRRRGMGPSLLSC